MGMDEKRNKKDKPREGESLRTKQDKEDREKKRRGEGAGKKEPSKVKKVTKPIVKRDKTNQEREELLNASEGGRLGEEEGSKRLEDDKQTGKIEDRDGYGGESGDKEGKKLNPLSFKGIRENVVNRGVDKSAKMALNSAGMGAGNAAERINKLMTGKNKVEYSKLVNKNKRGKIVLFLLTLAIFLLVWLFIAVAGAIILFGAVAVILSDDVDLNSGGSGGGDMALENPGSGKVMGMPPELVGKFIVPNTERMTSLQGPRNGSLHRGVDFAHRQPGHTSTKIYPIAPGVVFKVVDSFPATPLGRGFGNEVRIDHENGYVSSYAHFAPGAKVKVGDRVGLNTLIGIMGNSGGSRGHHLHLEIYKGGVADFYKLPNMLNPLDVLSCTDTKPMPRTAGTYTECYQYQQKVRGISGD